MSAPRKLETLRDVLRRDYKRRWRRKNPDKVKAYHQASKVRAWLREQGACVDEARAQP